MAISTDINKMLLDEVLGLYNGAELKMLEKIAKRTKEDLKGYWATDKIRDVRKVKRDVSKILSDTGAEVKGKMSKGIMEAYLTGVKSAEKDLHAVTTAISDVVPKHIERMILETRGLIDGTSFQILRNVEDTYREIIADTSKGSLLGVETPEQSAQKALNRFADKGITGFVDKAGRNWELSSYIEMATRTTTSRAALQGHIDRQFDIGNDLIKISSIGATCPLCSPWQGKVLSITGKTPGYDSLESAKAAGLFHPNCKHTIMAYFPEITDAPTGPQKSREEVEEKYRQTQQQRYNERQIRHWKKREVVALTPVEEMKAHNKVLEWQKVQRELISKTGLRRNYGRESIVKRTPKILPVTPTPIKPIKKPIDMNSLTNHLTEYVGGGYSSVKDAVTPEEFEYIQSKMKLSSNTQKNTLK